MNVIIIDYNSGNLNSVLKSFQYVANSLRTTHVKISNDPNEVKDADKIILPGVGAFTDCKNGINKIVDLYETLTERVKKAGVPFLGICVGHQMLSSYGYEHKIKTAGFDWISGDVMPLSPSNDNLKIPHMGWNSLNFDKQHPLFMGVEEGSHVYFAHSFHMKLRNPKLRISYVDYGEEVTAAIASNNIVGTQFHPEKSQKTGLKFIENFILWKT